MLTLYSWNVNGIRAAGRNGFLKWLSKAQPDVLCIQESKAQPDDLDPSLHEPKGYTSVWHSAERKGYSGTGTYFKSGCEPLSISPLGVERFDAEGRVQLLEFDDFTLINAYYPNSQPERRRLEYKLDFCTTLRKLWNKLRREGKHVVACGDFNIAHKDIDLARPKQNRDNPGFYPEECAAMDSFVRAGYVDVFRHFCKEPEQYTWWSYRFQARAKHIGWRLDYHWANKEFIDRVASSTIHADVHGADHCPVSIAVR
jgi:exodeoxyribonuclease-3